MNVRWYAVLLVVLLAVTAGCAQRPYQAKICVDEAQKDCKTQAELDQLMAAEFARQRRYAESLPFDYRDIVHALLVDYLRPPPVADVEAHYFVEVFGDNVDAPLAARLHGSGFDVLPASQWTPPDGREANGHHVWRVKIVVGEIKQVDRDTYAIGIAYYCGPLCAAGSTYTLRTDGNGWHVVDRQQHWIS